MYCINIYIYIYTHSSSPSGRCSMVNICILQQIICRTKLAASLARSGVQPDFVMYNSVMNICEQLGNVPFWPSRHRHIKASQKQWQFPFRGLLSRSCSMLKPKNNCLVGGLEQFCIFPSIGNNHLNCLSYFSEG